MYHDFQANTDTYLQTNNLPQSASQHCQYARTLRLSGPMLIDTGPSVHEEREEEEAAHEVQPGAVHGHEIL